MKSFIAKLSTALMVIISANAIAQPSADADIKEKARSWMQNQPIQFLENKGQMADMAGNPVPFVLFKASAPGMDMYITEKGLTYMFFKKAEREKKEHSINEKSGKDKKEKHEEEGAEIEYSYVDVELKGATIKKENIIREPSSSADYNYFYAHCPDGIYGVKEYEKIVIKNVYPNIDWIWYTQDKKGLKYDFLVHPGANPGNIKMLYKWADINPLENGKKLHINSKIGELIEGEAVSFCEGKEIDTRYHIEGKEVSFQISNYDRSQPLTIDPALALVWGTYCGGNGHDGFQSIAIDNSGNIFINGYCSSSNFPVQNLAGAYYDGTSSGFAINQYDMIILKFTNAGVKRWATFYGGAGIESGASIVLDGSGNLYFLGTIYGTAPSTQILAGGYNQAANAGGSDAFIIKFNSAGARQWATCYGGAGDEDPYSINVNSAGDVFITGGSASASIPFQNPGGGAYYITANAGGKDMFLTKFNNAGALQWGTFYGGTGEDIGRSIAVDASNNIFVTGSTASTNFPTFPLAGAYNQPANAGALDAFILKFSNAGSRVWATYYGGSGNENTDLVALSGGSLGGSGGCIATDASGNIYVTGWTESTNLTLQSPSYKPAKSGGYDAFFLKFSNNGAPLWGTYYGGGGEDLGGFWSGPSIDFDSGGNVYFTGSTKSDNLPTINPGGGAYFRGAREGGRDVYIISFDNSGTPTWATYSGSSVDDFGTSLAVDNSNNLFVIGEWWAAFGPFGSSNNALLNPGGGTYYQAANASWDDSFIMKFSPLCTAPTVTVTSQANVTCNGGNDGSATVSVTGGVAPYTYSWSPAAASTSAASGLSAGTYIVTVTASGCSAAQTITIAQPNAIAANPSSTGATCGNSDGTATVAPTGGTPGYTYAWSNGATTSQISNLASQTYSVTITDSKGCPKTATITVTQSGGPTVLTSTTPQTCAQGGTATASVSAGAAPYTYQWCNGASTSSATGLSAGSCTVIVTDANGCSTNATAAITTSGSIPVVTATVTPASCGNNNGTATATVTGGTSPYTYLWCNGQTASTATGLAAGSCTVTVTDANGCPQNATAIISPGNTFSINVISTPSGCSTSTGSATATPNGGTAPYTYLWSNGQTTSAATALGSSNYTVTITDANNCVSIQTVTIGSTGGPTAAAAASPVAITPGDSVILTGTGGGTYSWNNGTTGPVITVSPTVTTLYCVTVTDTSGCTGSACVTVMVETDCSNTGELFIPNAFSPNGDGENDSLYIYYGNIKCIKTYKLTVYNRWGDKIYKTTDPSQYWDGTDKGKPLNTAVFVYYMEATLTNGEKITKKGNISLIR